MQPRTIFITEKVTTAAYFFLQQCESIESDYIMDRILFSLFCVCVQLAMRVCVVCVYFFGCWTNNEIKIIICNPIRCNKEVHTDNDCGHAMYPIVYSLVTGTMMWNFCMYFFHRTDRLKFDEICGFGPLAVGSSLRRLQCMNCTMSVGIDIQSVAFDVPATAVRMDLFCVLYWNPIAKFKL